MLVTCEELNYFSSPHITSCFSVNAEVSLQSSTNCNKDIVSSNITLNLFGFIKVKTINVNVVNTNLTLCGNTVGIYIENNGVTVVGFGGVKSNNKLIYPFENSNIKVGDIITSINSNKIKSSKDIDTFLSSTYYTGDGIEIEYTNGKEIKYETIFPVLDTSTQSYKLGLWVRESATGIGTLTYITKNNRFGALGHGITENGQTTPMNITNGELYQCNILGIQKGQSGNAGEIKAMLKPNCVAEGFIEKNNEYGVFGVISDSSIFNKGQNFEIGGRLTAKPGKAYIYCQLDESTIKKYEVEIIKTNYQTHSGEKSMVLRVSDKELLSKTGGIIQGMSGSPIVQDNKIIGAVTHVFINDPSKGFGIYLDWMLDE